MDVVAGSVCICGKGRVGKDERSAISRLVVGG